MDLVLLLGATPYFCFVVIIISGLLFRQKISNEYDRSPDLNDEIVKGEIVELIYQKGKFDYNRKIIEEIQSDEFNENKFTELSSDKIQSGSINSINDDKLFEANSIKMLYSLPQNFFALLTIVRNLFFEVFDFTFILFNFLVVLFSIFLIDDWICNLNNSDLILLNLFL